MLFFGEKTGAKTYADLAEIAKKDSNRYKISAEIRVKDKEFITSGRFDRIISREAEDSLKAADVNAVNTEGISPG